MARKELIIKDTHRGLWYEDGVLTQVLGAGRHVVPRGFDLGFIRRPRVHVVLVDVRRRELTIKGQEILTADKVAIRVSIIVQFRVVEPRTALHEVENYEERLEVKAVWSYLRQSGVAKLVTVHFFDRE